MATLIEKYNLRNNPHLLARVTEALIVAAEAVKNEQQEFTGADTGDVFTATAHGYANGDKVELAGSFLPTGVVAAQRYFIVGQTANTFQLADISGGSAVVLTTDGYGNIAVLGHPARFTWASSVLLIKNGPEDEAERLVRLVLQNATIQDQYDTNPTTGGTTTDNDIQFVVDAFVNFAAGVET